MAKAPVLPGLAFASRPLRLKTVGVGETWRRIHLTRHPDSLGWGPGLNRFSDPTGPAFGVVYLGSSAKAAFVETLLRDRADGRGDDCVLELAEIEARTLVAIEVTAPLQLVDLTGDQGLRMGVPSDVVGSSDQGLAQAWSLAFHGHPEQPDGVYYPSRLNEERCIALYDRALRKLKVSEAPRLIDCAPELGAITRRPGDRPRLGVRAARLAQGRAAAFRGERDGAAVAEIHPDGGDRCCQTRGNADHHTS